LYVLVFFVQPIDGDFFAHVQHVQVVVGERSPADDQQ
jgi:hypothetical protein